MRDLTIVAILAMARILVHCLTNQQYGFHRDELMMFDDGRFLDWGYVPYPPFTPFVAHIARDFFGTSLVGLRFFAALAQGVAMILTGAMAKALGGRRKTVILAAMLVCVAPVSMGSGALFEYVSFDYLWWVVVAYGMVRLLQSGDERWWLLIGAGIGLGMQTKYTMAFLACGVAAGVVLTPARQYLKSRWLWAGVVLALLIFLPNLLWQVRHDFISLDMLKSIHARDVRIGRTDHFLLKQFLIGANLFTAPLWIAGLWFYWSERGKPYRAIAWMYIVPLALFTIGQGRDYYMAPAYPVLLAAGALVAERWSRAWRIATWSAVAVGGLVVAAVILPIAAVNSPWFEFASKNNGDLREEIGWPEFVQQIAAVRDQLPAEDRARLGILTGNYGEIGALHLYGPAYGLPNAISGVNTYWLRGYGDPPPQTLIVVGWSGRALISEFGSCEEAGKITNRYGVKNEETQGPGIYVCRGLLKPWPAFWKSAKHFG